MPPRAAVSPQRALLGRALALHACGLVGLTALAALGGSPTMMAEAVALLAVVTSQGVLWWQGLHDAAELSPKRPYFWTYGVAAVSFATAAGFAAAVACLLPAAAAGAWPQPLDGIAVALLCGGEWVWLTAATRVPGLTLTGIPPDMVWRAPVRLTLMVEAAGVVVVSAIAAIAVALSQGLGVARADDVGAAAISLVLAGLAVHFSLEMQRLVAGAVVDDATRLAVVRAMTSAAQKSGAVRQLRGIIVTRTAAAQVLAAVDIDFKAGTGAGHVAPVLAALQQAADTAIPDTVAVVLAPQNPLFQLETP